MKEKTPVLQSIIVGSTAAIIESSVNHPLWAFKMRVQSGKNLTFNPLILYRGLTIHMLSRIPTTAAQVLFSRIIQEDILSHLHSKAHRDLLSSLLGGVIAALVQSPAELVMTYQHKYGGNFLSQARNILNTKGKKALFTGYTGTALRLGLYTCSFFSAQPLTRNYFHEQYDLSYWESHILSAIIIGTLSTILSNPADLVKTIQQDKLPINSPSFSEVTKSVYKRSGIAGFFRGTMARASRVCTGVGIISYVNEEMQKKF